MGESNIKPIRLAVKSKILFIIVNYIFAPSTGMLVACMNDDLSLAMNNTVFAISSGVPKRFTAWWCLKKSLTLGSPALIYLSQ